MNQYVAKLWVKALRSGKVKRAKNVLGSTDSLGLAKGYCCLGVLCEISGKPYDKKCKYPPSSVCSWAGLKTERGEFPDALNRKYSSLVELNDQGNWSFRKIADFIEANYEVL